MKLSVPIRNIIFIWLGWAVILLGFQNWVQMRIELKRPDTVLDWTVTETGSTSNKDQPYLIDPFLNGHVAWDSEFYLAIAGEGYDSSQVRAIPLILVGISPTTAIVVLVTTQTVTPFPMHFSLYIHSSSTLSPSPWDGCPSPKRLHSPWQP